MITEDKNKRRGRKTGALDEEKRLPEPTQADSAAERLRLYNVLETLPVYVILLSENYHVPFANKFFRERFGESHGRRCFEYLFELTGPCENCETYTALKNNAPHHWYWTGPDKRDYDIYDYPFTDTDGSKMVLEMGIDITEHKRADEELRRHKEKLEELVKERTNALEARNAQIETVLESATEGLVIADLDGKLFHWNRAALDAHGFSDISECRRMLPEFTAIFELSSADGQVLPVEQWPLARILRGEILRDWEINIRRLEGDWRRVFLYSGALARDKAGEPILAIVSVRDITDRKEAEAKIRRHADDLQAANEELTRFNRAAVGRELRMIELKAEVNQLCANLGEPLRYPMDFENEK